MKVFATVTDRRRRLGVQVLRGDHTEHFERALDAGLPSREHYRWWANAGGGVRSFERNPGNRHHCYYIPHSTFRGGLKRVAKSELYHD